MQLLIFDLDGTLIDSSRDLAIATNATLRFMARPEVDDALVNSYVGDGAAMLVKRALGGDTAETDFEKALGYFIDYYRAHSLIHTKLYPGVREALDQLKAVGHTLAVLTNKPVRISRDILSELGVAGHFFRVYGGNSFAGKKPDPIGVHTLIGESGIDRQHAIMIGDTDVDIRTARNAGIRACGVTWGFRPESLSNPAPDFLIDDIDQLIAEVQP